MPFATEGAIGVDLDRVDTEAKFQVGSAVIGSDGFFYVYTEDAPEAGEFSWVQGADARGGGS